MDFFGRMGSSGRYEDKFNKEQLRYTLSAKPMYLTLLHYHANAFGKIIFIN